MSRPGSVEPPRNPGRFTGGQTRIYVYDNRCADQECVLTLDTDNPGPIVETLADGSALPGGNNGDWEGLLVSDGYQSQTPSYGQDIGIASPQALKLSGPVVMAPIAASPGIMSLISGRSAGAAPPAGGAMPITTTAQQQQLASAIMSCGPVSGSLATHPGGWRYLSGQLSYGLLSARLPYSGSSAVACRVR
jgi:hypothetical protein